MRDAGGSWPTPSPHAAVEGSDMNILDPDDLALLATSFLARAERRLLRAADAVRAVRLRVSRASFGDAETLLWCRLPGSLASDLLARSAEKGLSVSESVSSLLVGTMGRPA